MSRLEQLACESNGAIEVGEATELPVIVFLAGPIKQWWVEGSWDTDERRNFFEWRDAITAEFVKSGLLVYSPHKAWRGSWHPRAQDINNAAIEMADFLVDMTPNCILYGEGTRAEIEYARSVGTAVYRLGNGGYNAISEAVATMKASLRPSPKEPTS